LVQASLIREDRAVFQLHGGATLVTVEGGNTHGLAGGYASTGPYVQTSYHGGSGAFTADFFSPAGGGAGAGTCGPGADGSAGTGYGGGSCGGGSGGDPNGTGIGGAPGGGGAAIFGNNNTFGGNGKVTLTYTCNPGNVGSIGNGHTITYPAELVPDSVTNIVGPDLASGVSIGWEQSTNGTNFVTSKTVTTTPAYRFDTDGLLATTYYRRGTNACITNVGSFGNWSNTVQIKVFTSANGRNGQITGYVQTSLGSPIPDRKVFVQSLTPLKGRAVGFSLTALTQTSRESLSLTAFFTVIKTMATQQQ
jgi:hypothetical protein